MGSTKITMTEEDKKLKEKEMTRVFLIPCGLFVASILFYGGIIVGIVLLIMWII